MCSHVHIQVILWFFRDPDFMTGWAPAISPGGKGFVKVLIVAASNMAQWLYQQLWHNTDIQLWHNPMTYKTFLESNLGRNPSSRNAAPTLCHSGKSILLAKTRCWGKKISVILVWGDSYLYPASHLYCLFHLIQMIQLSSYLFHLFISVTTLTNIIRVDPCQALGSLVSLGRWNGNVDFLETINWKLFDFDENQRTQKMTQKDFEWRRW